jgi:hypothetical protein
METADEETRRWRTKRDREKETRRRGDQDNQIDYAAVGGLPQKMQRLSLSW